MELYLIKRTCIEQTQNKSGVASPMISISVDMPENAQEKKINSTLAIRSLEAIMSIKIEGQTDANQTLLSLILFLQKQEGFWLKKIDVNRYLEKKSHLA